MSTQGFQFTFDLPANFQINHLKIAVVKATWNTHIIEALHQGASDVLIQAGLPPQNIKVHQVSGSFELPLAAQWALEAGADAVICLGCLIKGDTPHFEFISQAVSAGIMEVGLKFSKPVIFGVITTLTEAQALDRAGGIHGNKGAEAAFTALQMCVLKYSN